MIKIYEELNRLLSEGQKAVLIRIIHQTGSTPRSKGAALVVAEDGSNFGTIGGGALEYQALEKAGAVIEQGLSSILRFRLTGQDVTETDMLCGGNVDVYLEPVFPENSLNREIFQSLIDLYSKGHKSTLLSLVSEGLGFENTHCRMLIVDGVKSIGNLEQQLTGDQKVLEKWRTIRSPQLDKVEFEGRKFSVFADPITTGPILYLFGAGHVSTFVAPLAQMVGFSVCVIDDRAEFANPERFPGVDEIIALPFDDVFERISIESSAYVAIITRGHSYDRDVLKNVLQANPAYVGMIGSLRKRNLIYQSLLEDGVKNEKIEMVHCPIGLDIGAETPEEIAVSIVAELIRVREHGPVAKKGLSFLTS